MRRRGRDATTPAKARSEYERTEKDGRKRARVRDQLEAIGLSIEGSLTIEPLP